MPNDYVLPLSEGRQVDYYVDGIKTPCTQDATHKLQGSAFLLSLQSNPIQSLL